MKKIWLLSPFRDHKIINRAVVKQKCGLDDEPISPSKSVRAIFLRSLVLAMLASPLFADDLNKCEAAKQSMMIGKKCAPGSHPAIDYRLPGDFYGVDAFVEYLYWQIQEQGSVFAASPNETSAINLAAPYTEFMGNLQSASFNWNSGVRLGLGYTFPRDAWQLMGQYTFYDTDGSNSFSVPTPITASTTQFLMPVFADIEGTGLVTASSRAHFTFQMADLLLARRFIAKDQIQLNFSLGTTGGYITENLTIAYNNVGMNTFVVNDWQFGGGGLRTGIDGNWHIGYGFGFFGKLSFAAILGQYTNTNRITADSPGAIVGTIASPRNSNLAYQGILLLPITQIDLGFDWCRSFTNCCVSAVKASLAGEFNNLSNLQQIYKNMAVVNTTSSTSNNSQYLGRDIGNVFMYGITIRLGADF